MRTLVAIIGAGPAGLLLSQLLRTAGVDCVVLEQRDRAHVEGHIRAGVLEQVTVGLLERAGVAGRLHAEGLARAGFGLAVDGDAFHGVRRSAIPADIGRAFERIYPFGWLGILTDAPPCGEELIYCNHARGFALAENYVGLPLTQEAS